MPSVGSLFSGCGGMDLGFHRAGFQAAWFVELDATARAVLRRHWPDVPQFEDVRTVGSAELAPVDVLIGGWPCQDHSIAGKRRGFAGESSSLFWEFARIAAELRPRWIVAENVAGLLSQPDEFRAVITELDRLGYLGCWRLLDLQFFGAPQSRDRIFFVAGLGTAGERASAVLFEPEGVCGDSQAGERSPQDVARTLRASTGSRGTDDPDRLTYVPVVARTLEAFTHGYSPNDQSLVPVVAPALTHRMGKGGFTDPVNDGLIIAAQCHGSNVGPMGTLRAGSGSAGGGVPFIAAAVTASAGHHGHSRPRGDGSDNQVVAFTERRREGGRQLEIQPDIAYAQQTAGGHGTRSRQVAVFTEDGMAVRRLMPIECERLMGWPDGWTAFGADGRPVSDTGRYQMIGNGCGAPVAEWIARRLLVVMEVAA